MDDSRFVSARLFSRKTHAAPAKHQKLATGGEFLYNWARTPQDYSTMSSANAAMDSVAPNGTLTVIPYVGS